MRKLKTWFASYSPKDRLKWCVLALAALLLAATLATVIVKIAGTQMEYAEAGNEYDALREAYKPQAAKDAAAGSGEGSTGQSASQDAKQIELPKDPTEVNPDYAGWIEIPGTKLDYPFVQAGDNAKYLNATFEGVRNPSGAVFMDAGCIKDFSSYHTVLYGHNIKNGSMFGTLAKYADAAYLAQHPLILITDSNGNTRTYRIFAARTTDMYDAAYRLDFASEGEFAAFAAALGAPEGATQMLTLSTCTNSADDNERFLVHAALVE